MKYEVLSAGGRNQRGGWFPERLCSPLERDPGRRALLFFAVMYENVSGVAVFSQSLPFPSSVLKYFKPTKKLKNKFDNHSLFYLYSQITFCHICFIYTCNLASKYF